MRPSKNKEQVGSSKHEVESKGMYRLQLGKTTTNFFSERGNNRLKRIWLDNNLHEEIIFSSWNGPSEALIRQKVSDYVQAFLLRRSTNVPLRDNGMFLFLRRFNVHRDRDLPSNVVERKKYEYYDEYVQRTLKKRFGEREEAEKRRIEKSIAKDELPVIDGFEYLSHHPIYRVQQLEKRMKYLSKIPLPYNQANFDDHILPIMTFFAIEEENKIKQCCSNNELRRLQHESSGTASKVKTPESIPREDSGVESNDSFGSDFSSDNEDVETELMQIFSEINLKSKDQDLDNTLSDVCELCGGFLKCDINDGLTCRCMSSPIWDDARASQTALSLYDDSSKIVALHTMKQMFCKDYIDQFPCKSLWVDGEGL